MKMFLLHTLILVLGTGVIGSSMAQSETEFQLPYPYEFVIPIHAGLYRTPTRTYQSYIYVSTVEKPDNGVYIRGFGYEKGKHNSIDCALTTANEVIYGSPPYDGPWTGQITMGGCGYHDEIGYALVGFNDPIETYTSDDVSGILQAREKNGNKIVTSVPAVRPDRKFFVPMRTQTKYDRLWRDVSFAIVNPFKRHQANVTITPFYKDSQKGVIERPECTQTRVLEPESGITFFSKDLFHGVCHPKYGAWIESDVPIAVSALMNEWEEGHRFWSVPVKRFENEMPD